PNNLAKTTARENDKPVTISSSQRTLLAASLRNGVVLMIDTSKSTDNNGTLAEARAAARALVQTMPRGTQFAVVAAGSDSQVVQKFTSDPAAIDKALTSLTPQGDGAMWEGVATAAAQFKDQPDLYGSIVLFTDGNTGKGVSYSDAQGAVSEVG